MFFGLKKILIFLVIIGLLGVGIFFFAFLAIFIIPLGLILFAFRKALFKRMAINELNSFSKKKDSFRNNENYIEAEYKKEKEEDA